MLTYSACRGIGLSRFWWQPALSIGYHTRLICFLQTICKCGCEAVQCKCSTAGCVHIVLSIRSCTLLSDKQTETQTHTYTHMYINVLVYCVAKANVKLVYHTPYITVYHMYRGHIICSIHTQCRLCSDESASPPPPPLPTHEGMSLHQRRSDWQTPPSLRHAALVWLTLVQPPPPPPPLLAPRDPSSQ